MPLPLLLLSSVAICLPLAPPQAGGPGGAPNTIHGSVLLHWFEWHGPLNGEWGAEPHASFEAEVDALHVEPVVMFQVSVDARKDGVNHGNEALEFQVERGDFKYRDISHGPKWDGPGAWMSTAVVVTVTEDALGVKSYGLIQPLSESHSLLTGQEPGE